jgi:hypothetical protein
MDFTLSPSPSLSTSDLKLVCNVNIVYGNLKYENSQDYARKPQRNCAFMNSTLVLSAYCKVFETFSPTVSV